MEITPTTSNDSAGLTFAACPPAAVAFGWLLLLTAPDGLDGFDQVIWGFIIGFFASLVSPVALLISIKAVRAGGAHRRLAIFGAVGNALITLQAATILVSIAAYQLFWR